MRSFSAMGTDVRVIAGRDAAHVTAQVKRTFADAEQRFSRFLPDSELSRLNRATEPAEVSEELFDALWRARAYLELTEGVFDPAVGAAMHELGYDRTFAPGALDRPRRGAPARRASMLEVTLDPVRRTVERPPHVLLDLGGMMKGRTVDRAARHLAGHGVVDAGGDARLVGDRRTPWRVEVEDPRDPRRTVASMWVEDGAVATSAANRRRWRVGSGWAHHLVDPRTGEQAESDLLQATVLAPSAELADVLAKTVFVLGSRQARAALARWDRVGAVLVSRTGRVSVIGELAIEEVRSAR
ncbi:MAG: FAD:protein FMN transferase [Sandaracinus sp.]